MEWRDVILSDIIMHESLSNIVQHKSSLAVEILGSGMYLCLSVIYPNVTHRKAFKVVRKSVRACMCVCVCVCVCLLFPVIVPSM